MGVFRATRILRIFAAKQIGAAEFHDQKTCGDCWRGHRGACEWASLGTQGLGGEVLEQAPELAEVGAGIQISPNGMAALERLGVLPLIEDTLFEPEAIELRMGLSGRRVFRLPMKGYAQDRWGHRFVQIHRADLHDALLQALRRQPSAQLRTNAKITGYVRERAGPRST